MFSRNYSRYFSCLYHCIIVYYSAPQGCKCAQYNQPPAIEPFVEILQPLNSRCNVMCDSLCSKVLERKRPSGRQQSLCRCRAVSVQSSRPTLTCQQDRWDTRWRSGRRCQAGHVDGRRRTAPAPLSLTSAYSTTTSSFILTVIISIPSPPHSFIPGLKPSFSANPSHRSLPFLLPDCLPILLSISVFDFLIATVGVLLGR